MNKLGWLAAAALFSLLSIFSPPLQAHPLLHHRDVLKMVRLSEDTTTFSFAVVGDSRGGLDILERLLRRMETRKPLFVLHTGDLVGESTARNYRAALAILQRSPLPILAVMGNHDRAREGPYRFLETFGEADYSFDAGNARFIILDDSQGMVTDNQLRWLEERLRTDKRKFVLAHIPPHYGRWEHAFYPNSERFMSLVERYKTDYCLFSHIHFYDHFQRNGTRYVVSGGGGAPLYYHLPLMAPDGGYFYHFLWFTVTPGGVTLEVVRLE